MASITLKKSDGSHDDIMQKTMLLWRELVPMLNEHDVSVELKKADSAYTKKQQGSLHVWCDMCAEYLDSLGEQCKIDHPFGGEPYELPWNKILFKEHVYKYVLKAMTGLDSTEKQKTVDPSKVAAVIHQRAAKNGMQLPSWPSRR